MYSLFPYPPSSITTLPPYTIESATPMIKKRMVEAAVGRREPHGCTTVSPYRLGWTLCTWRCVSILMQDVRKQLLYRNADARHGPIVGAEGEDERSQGSGWV
jgi:hypothetical protein